MKIFVTGANGFIGKCFIQSSNEWGVDTVQITREPQYNGGMSYEEFFDYKHCHSDSVLIHLAGAAHAKFNDELAIKLNLDLSRAVFLKAAQLKVRRVIFISTVSLYNEQVNSINLSTPIKKREMMINTTYTKFDAEQCLRNIASESSIDYTIIRSPLVYGAGVKANFASLMKLVSKGLPLPFRLINNNKRSLVSVYNLVDLIQVCISHPKAANQVFLVSDEHDLSTAEMVALMANVQGKKNFALPVPVWCFKLAGKLLNKTHVIDRLTGSLQLDITHTKNTLGWEPPYSVEHGFKLAVKKP
ncbi:MAG: NAD-dependent epimerase/dehydratase family protein [Colwellia sp.]|nr:NAD-dependent epimerase/dehydratase family protein [Colwellia sp.]